MKHLTTFWLIAIFLSFVQSHAQTTDLLLQYNLDNMQSGTQGDQSRQSISNGMDVGYNAAFAFYDIMLKKCESNDYFENTPCAEKDNRCINPDFKKSFDLLKPTTNILRFPGGEIANFYHFGELDPSGCFTTTKGYGVKDMEIINRKNVNNFTKEKKEPVRTNRNAIFDLVELCKVYPDLEIVYVMNLATHFLNWEDSVKAYWFYHYNSFDNWEDILADPYFQSKMQENFNAIRFLQSHGIKIRGIELGNEFYMNDYPATLSVSNSEEEQAEFIFKYNNLVQLYSDSIRTLFPGIPMGVPYSDRNIMFEKQWNKALLQNYSYFDAFVIHDYYTGDEPFTMHEYCKSKLEEKIIAVKNFIGGTGKKIWITEWNMLFGHTGLKNELDNAAYVFDYMTAIMDINSKHGDIVEVMTLHNLAAWSKTSPLLKAQGNYFGQKQPYVKANPSVWGAYMVNLFDHIITSDRKWSVFNDLHYNTADSVSAVVDKNEVFFKPFWQPGGDVNGIMYFANLSDQSYKLSKENSYVYINGQNYSFNELDSRVNMGGSPAYNIFYIDSIANDSVFSEEYIHTDTAVIPANSIGLIVTSYLHDPASARKSNTTCTIRQSGISLDDLRNNMDNMWSFLCDGRQAASPAVTAPNTTSIYPNPASRSLWVKTDIKNARMQIFDQMGVRVYFAPALNESDEINISNLPMGMYHYLITGDEEQESGHFIVQRR